MQTPARSVNRRRSSHTGGKSRANIIGTQSSASRGEEYTQLSEDRLLFDGPRATYGRFRVLHQIGAGSVGPVFRGEDGETRDPVVIKVIRVGLTPERVAIVAAALAGLRERLPAHPTLAPLIASGVVDVEPFLVSPFVDGDSLDVALREYGPANMADALPRLRRLADAMDAAAAVGAAHGSLHLRDITVSVGETVLTGVGVASVLERVGVRPPVRRPYCAPEVALGHGISPAGDQYALAAIAHEWLSGRRLAGSGAAGFQVPMASEAGAVALQAVFARAMHDSPDGRFPTATAFIEAIAGLAGDAAPRSKTSRRAASVEAPRLSFDDLSEPALTLAAPDHDDDVAPDDEIVPEHAALSEVETSTDDVVADVEVAGAADDIDDIVYAPEEDAVDPLDTPLRAADVRADLEWEPAAPPPARAAFSALDDDPHEDDGPSFGEAHQMRLSVDAEPHTLADEASDPSDSNAADESAEPSAWTSWVAWLVVLTGTALVGGWLLLRWGTPSPDAAPSSTVASAPGSSAPAPSVAPSTSQPAAPAADIVPTPRPEAAAAASTTRSAPAAPEPGATPVRPPPSAPPPPARTAGRPNAPPRPFAGPAAARKQTPTRAPARPARAATPAAARSGRVLVRSTPGGAEVFVNGERRGVTPLALRDLPFGAYAVRVVRSGFAPVEQRVAIDAGRPARAVEVTLTRVAASVAATPPAAADAAAPGSMIVESRPAGARVIVDGASVGVTPVTLPTLAPGLHTVRIELAGYAPVSTSTRVEARSRARVAVTLTAERPR